MSANHHNPVPSVEPLEPRQLLAATPTSYAIPLNDPRLNFTLNRRIIVANPSPSAGTLNVSGTPGNDQIRITRTPTQIVVNVNGRGSFAPISSTTRIRINAIGGHDRILIVDPAGKPVTVDAGPGNDYISSGPGHDHLYGGPGRDWIQANAGRDFINGGLGDDSLEGGAGDDILTGDLGSDRLFGQTGNDFFYANDGAFDMVDGGIGTDEALVDKALPVIDGRNSIEVLR